MQISMSLKAEGKHGKINEIGAHNLDDHVREKSIALFIPSHFVGKCLLGNPCLMRDTAGVANGTIRQTTTCNPVHQAIPAKRNLPHQTCT